MERLVETAAREMGIDRVELRRLNHIQPEQMPYRAPSGMMYDCGEFPTVMEKALIAATGILALRVRPRAVRAARCEDAVSVTIWA